MKTVSVDRRAAQGHVWQHIHDYWDLTKPRLVWLVLFSTAAGFYLGSTEKVVLWSLWHAVAGTGLVAAGSQTLNQWMERDYDARMTRTATRVLPAGRLTPGPALIWGVLLSILGLIYLWAFTNPVSTGLALITLVSYLALYTPLKRKTSLCILVGALPGALPPLIGWTAAAGGTIAYGGLILFTILFLWQMPHFLAIGWMHRADYAKAGFYMLPSNSGEGTVVGRQIFIYTAVMFVVSLLPIVSGMTGMLYYFGAFALGIGFMGFTIASYHQMERHARSVFRASIVYLPLLLLLMVMDKV